MSGIELRVLGRLQVIDSGRDVTPRPAKQRALLIRLLLDANRTVSSDRLVDALWGERPPPSARNLLQVYVSQLRSVLGRHAIETDPPGYAINVAPEDLDAWRFEQLLAEGRTALDDGNAPLAASLLRRALELWRGPALDDVADEAFVVGEARRLNELHLVCLEERLAAYLELGRHDEVVAEAAALVAEHPLREQLRRHLVVALYRAGRQAEALKALRELGRALRDELGLEPSGQLRELERAVLRQDRALAGFGKPARLETPLPTPLTSLLGRDRELTELRELVERSDVRLVTIAGAGGSGKTRLALELARCCETSFANGAALVELAAVRDVALVLPTIASSFGVVEQPAEPLAQTLGKWLGGRELLLVVDNLEHLVAAAVDLVALAAAAPRLTIVATSRRVLHVSGEHVYPLEPLHAEAALELFLGRSRARDPGFALTSATEAIAREVCRRVDCLPLAIELAAAQTSSLGLPALQERLEARLGFLTAGPRDLPARQQTLRAALAWSTDLLTPAERADFARLAIFAGSFSTEAGESVAGTAPERLASLVEQSLVGREHTSSNARFTMLETVREHALELLVAEGEQEEAARRHASYFARLVAGPEPREPHKRAWLLSLDPELENFRVAMDWAEEACEWTLALQLATGLYRYWHTHALFREGRQRIETALEAGGGDETLRAHAMRALAGLTLMLGNHEAARRLVKEGIEVGTRVGALEAVVGCHNVLGHLQHGIGDLRAAREHHERSGNLAAEIGDRDGVAIANTNLGEVAFAAGDLDEARRRWEQTLAWNEGGDESATVFARLSLGVAALEQGRKRDAAEQFQRALKISESPYAPQLMGNALVGLAAVAEASGHVLKAARLLADGARLYAETGSAPIGSDGAVYERTLDALRKRLGIERLEALLNDAREPPDRPDPTRPGPSAW